MEILKLFFILLFFVGSILTIKFHKVYAKYIFKRKDHLFYKTAYNFYSLEGLESHVLLSGIILFVISVTVLVAYFVD